MIEDAEDVIGARWPIRRIVRTVWATAGVLFFVWMWTSYQSKGVSPETLQSDAGVAVQETDDAIAFEPVGRTSTALLFLPGGMVEPLAYAPPARAIAENGFGVYIVKLPWRSAPLARHRTELAQRIAMLMETHPEIEQWVIGGHSRGAALAVQLVHAGAVSVDGVALVGTTHPKSADTDLSDSQSRVLKIYATQDGIASPSAVLSGSEWLPTSTAWVEIVGGNHAQFGYYGSQLLDGDPTITRAEQQEALVEALSAFLREFR